MNWLQWQDRWVATPARQGVRLLCAAGLVACGGGSAGLDQRTSMPGGPTTTMSAWIGANMPAVSDYAFTPVYADLVHQARRFGPVDSPWGGTGVPVGGDGWPTTDFGVFLMSAKGAFAGTYRGIFTGQAWVELIASRDSWLANIHYDASTNQTSFDVIRGASPDVDNMVLTFSQTRRAPSSPLGSGIAQLQLIRPGYDRIHAPLFTNEFLHHIARFKTLRFMDWLHANNNNAVTTWDSRARPDTHYASSAGVPWEHIVALANQTRKDIWINIPVYADDDYVRQLAMLLQSSLNSDSRIYVEYSNELWNAGFWQFGWSKALAQAEVASAAADQVRSPLAYDGNVDPNVWLYRRIAKRGKEISDIFRQVYGDAAMMTRVRPVFASQAAQPYVSKLGLDFIADVYGPPSRYFYALAIADYFGVGTQPEPGALSVDEVIEAMSHSVDAMPAQSWFETNLALARWHNMPLLAYEGGADTFGPLNVAAKKAASLDPRMLALCLRHLSHWYQAGGGLFMWYTAGAGNWDTPYGTWELTTDLAVADTPKLQCIDTLRNSAPPTVRYRNVAPGTFSALSYVDNPGPPFAPQSEAAVRYRHPGSPPIDYLVHAGAGGSYALVLTTGTQVNGNTVDVHVNGVLVASDFELRVTPGFDMPLDNAPIPIHLTAGFNTLRITTRAENTGSSSGAGGYRPATLTIR